MFKVLPNVVIVQQLSGACVAKNDIGKNIAALFDCQFIYADHSIVYTFVL
jgi:hypothetical protein